MTDSGHDLDAASPAQRLTARLAELQASVRRIEQAQRQPLDDDFAEQAVEREDDEALDGVERAALAEIALTQQALARLSAGDYGRCVSCGAAIDPARLDAMPAAAQCIRCASGAVASER